MVERGRARLVLSCLRDVRQLTKDDAGPPRVTQAPPALERLLEDGLGPDPIPQFVRLVAEALEGKGPWGDLDPAAQEGAPGTRAPRRDGGAPCWSSAS